MCIDDIEAREQKGRYWRVVGMQEVGTNQWRSSLYANTQLRTRGFRSSVRLTIEIGQQCAKTIDPMPQLMISSYWRINMYLPFVDHLLSDRKYKDYVYGRCYYRSTWKNKEYLWSKDKAKNDMMYQDIHSCIYQNKKKWRYTIQYVKPTAQLVFKNRFPKGGPTCRRQVVYQRHQTSQGQSVAKPETPLQNIQVE